jgi:hypothetical protein
VASGTRSPTAILLRQGGIQEPNEIRGAIRSRFGREFRQSSLNGLKTPRPLLFVRKLVEQPAADPVLFFRSRE